MKIVNPSAEYFANFHNHVPNSFALQVLVSVQNVVELDEDEDDYE